jgi:hypothetical protein
MESMLRGRQQLNLTAPEVFASVNSLNREARLSENVNIPIHEIIHSTSLARSTVRLPVGSSSQTLHVLFDGLP